MVAEMLWEGGFNMKKFSESKNPLLTAMFGGKTQDEFIELIKKTKLQGAEAFCLLMQGIESEYKNKESYKRIFDAAEGKPIYVTNYIRDNSEEDKSDDRLAEELIEMLTCGADMIDVRGDMFLPSADEFTKDAAAVKKQADFISEIHNMGGEVIMSTHIFEYRSPSQVLEIAKNQLKRGTDIAKVVTVANTPKELDDAFETIFLLKKELEKPFLYLCNGSHCIKHRNIGPFLGTKFYLCLENSNTGGPQPTIEKAKFIRDTVLGGDFNE